MVESSPDADEEDLKETFHVYCKDSLGGLKYLQITAEDLTSVVRYVDSVGLLEIGIEIGEPIRKPVLVLLQGGIVELE